MKDFLKEITALKKDSLYLAEYWPEAKMDFPIHFHDDFELNLTLNARGKRIVGNLIEDFAEQDLTIISPNVLHCYKRETPSPNCVVVVKFSKDLPVWEIFQTVQFAPIRNMLSLPVAGIKFSGKVADMFTGPLVQLSELDGFEGACLFLKILNGLATVDKSDVDIIGSEVSDAKFTYSRRINKIIKYVEANYQKKISLDEIGELVGMSASSVSRFFKKRTLHNFWDYLSSFRIDCAADMLIRTEHNISEISYECGFNNLSNFNKVFRERIGCTPSEYRSKYKNSSIGR